MNDGPKQLQLDNPDKQTLEHWLAEHQLAHLLPVFQQHEIDLDILFELGQTDLGEMGLSLGDRKRVLKAIASGASQAEQIGKEPSLKPSSAERRQITVLFCDLVGSSRLTASLDPEESRSVIRGYRAVVAAEIEKYGGHVAQYLGDGVLAYFGWPLAQEDAAHRAVTAGLAIIDEVASHKTLLSHQLAVRLGAATGMVVIGASDTGDQTEDMTAVGDVVNIAARLQELAQPGGLVIGESTQLLVATSFEVTAKGEYQLKGIVKPVAVFEVEGQSASPRKRPDAAGQMSGREEEMKLALSSWSAAATGNGQVLLITGEPGIGKSHLTERLIQAISDNGLVPTRYYCSPYQHSTALHPIIEELRSSAALSDGDDAMSDIEKLHAYLGSSGQDAGAAMPSLLRLLSLPSDNWPETEGTTPMIRKAQTFAALTALALDRARRQPALFVLEDAHWIDPTSLEFIEQLVEQCRNLPVMFLINARPDFRPHWHDRGNVTTIALQRLARGDIEAVIAAASGERVLDAALVTSIVERSDGIPLFVEELTKAIVEFGFTGKGDAAAIPSSLRDTLMARLDRHPEARDVAQVAACIGRECDHELLAVIAGKTAAQLEAALEKLAKAEIVFRVGQAPNVSYRFKHALVQEFAADSLLKSKRRDVHNRIAQFLEARRSDFAIARPELLAHHFTQAQNLSVAIRYRQLAGNQAVAASGNLEAIGEYGLALQLITLLPASEDRDRTELDILIAQAIPYTLTKGYAAPEVEAVYKRAMDTSARLPQEKQSFAVIYGFWRFYLLRGDYANALALSRQLLQISETRKDTAMDVTSNRAAGSTRFYMARFTEALQHLGRTAGIQPDEHFRRSILAYDVVDPWVVTHAYSGMALWIHGKPTEAVQQNERAIALARQVNHPFTLALALCFAQWTHQFSGDRERVQALSHEALALSHKYGFTFWTGWAEMMLAWAEGGVDHSPTRQRMKVALQLWQSTGSQLGLSYFQCLLAEQCDGAETRLLLDAAEKFANEREELFWLPDIHRMNGRHVLRENYDDAMEMADAAYRRALLTAEHLQANGLALRASLDLARLHLQGPGWQAACEQLQLSVARFGIADSFADLELARDALRRAASGQKAFDGT